MYSLHDFGSMNADADRFGAYSNAIASTVRPGDAVVEIGCGPGVFALLACRAGARKVYAIESEAIIHFARELATANHFSDRIDFFQSDSRKTELPERVNVIVSDIRGAVPLYDHAIPSIEDARQRFLVPGGILIPQRDTMKAAVLEADEYYSKLTAPWRNTVPGLDLSLTLPMVLNRYYGATFKREQLLTEPQSWCELDYTSGAPTRAAAELRFCVARSGTAHGVCVWFEAQLCEGIGYSSGPGAEGTIYGQLFFPWLDAVPVTEGQEIQVGLHADLVGGDYVWRWETVIPQKATGTVQRFRQSTFQGEPFSPESLRRHAVDYVPILSEIGEAERWLLQAMDGRASLQEITQSTLQRFPKLYPRWEDAFQRAAELAEKLSR
jgi:type I protein arginine methyltransferase